jgi:hypothetical protein
MRLGIWNLGYGTWILRFVDIGGIDDLQCLSFLLITNEKHIHTLFIGWVGGEGRYNHPLLITGSTTAIHILTNDKIPHIRFHSTRPHAFTKMNDKKNGQYNTRINECS